MTVGGMKMTASTEKSLMMSFCARLMRPSVASSRNCTFCALKLASCSSDCRSRNADFVASRTGVGGASFRQQEQQQPLDRHQAFAQVRDLLVRAPERVEGGRIDPAAAALVALGPEDGASDRIELLAYLVERASGAVDDGVDETDRHRVGMKRRRARLAELLPEELERVAGIIAHRDQRGRGQNEGDAGNVGRILRLADKAGVEVAHPILGAIGFGRFSVIGIAA